MENNINIEMVDSESEEQLYKRYERYLLGSDKASHGYPIKADTRADDGTLMRKPPVGATLNHKFASQYSCKRCKKVFEVDSRGIPVPLSGQCTYHSGSVWYHQLDGRYSCCKQKPGQTKGCKTNKYHVHEAELELENFIGYVETQPRGAAGRKIFGIDCEMCFTTVGLELTKVTVINYKQEIIYETLAKPLNPILDYNTMYSGLKHGDLDDVKKTLPDVQKDLLKIISAETILIGHVLNSDMNELKIIHGKFIDTAALHPHKKGLPFKRPLKLLVEEFLHRVIQSGNSGHDSA